MYVDINAEWTTSYLITFIKNRIGRQDIELVQMCQERSQNMDTIDAEDASALVESDISLFDTFRDDWTIGFYIRTIELEEN